jgi:hypothetical protein
MGEHNQAGVRFFAPKEEEHVPAPTVEEPAGTTRPVAKPGKVPAKKK